MMYSLKVNGELVGQFGSRADASTHFHAHYNDYRDRMEIDGAPIALGITYPEFWVINTRRGPRAYIYDFGAMRTRQVAYAEAMLREATGVAVRIEKPQGLGRAA